MKISELAEKLKAIHDKHGDLEVFCESKMAHRADVLAIKDVTYDEVACKDRNTEGTYLKIDIVKSAVIDLEDEIIV